MAYQTRDVLDAMRRDSNIAPHTLRVDGGAIANDFLAQFQADILDVPVQRARSTETTALGAAYLAGLAVGFWQDREQVARQWQAGRSFTPALGDDEREALYADWKRAVGATLEFRIT
jgi:glycerol kinase